MSSIFFYLLLIDFSYLTKFIVESERSKGFKVCHTDSDYNKQCFVKVFIKYLIW